MAKISKDIPVESSINLLYGGGSIFSFGISFRKNENTLMWTKKI
jgi:hypothetical protein